jgi:hypothetical protein
MRFVLPAVGIGLGAVLSVVVLEHAGQRLPESSSERIARLIKELDANEFHKREQATDELLRLGDPVVGPLKHALTANPTPEMRSRIERVLADLAQERMSRALTLHLKADKDKIKFGEKLKLTTTIQNMLDDDLNVYLGYCHWGVYFECGKDLHMAAQAAANDVPPKQRRVGFCGNGMGPIFKTMPGHTKLEFTAALTLKTNEGNWVLNGGEHDYFYHVLSGPGQYRFRMVHQATPQNNIEKAFDWDPTPKNPQAPYWIGIVRSNDVIIEVLPPSEDGEALGDQDIDG